MPKTFDEEYHAGRPPEGGWTGKQKRYYDDLAEKDQWLYDNLIDVAGDDKELSVNEILSMGAGQTDHPYLNKYGNRVGSDVFGDLQLALGKVASKEGIKLDKEVQDRWGFTYDKGDLMQRIAKTMRGPDWQTKQDYDIGFEYDRDDGDKRYNVWRWSPMSQELEEEEAPVDPVNPVDPVDPVDPDKNEYADNPWEEPEKTPSAVAKKRTDWDRNWDPTRYVDDSSELGSIDYWTPTMSSSYKPSLTEGKFSRYVTGDTYDHSKRQIESVLRAAGYRGDSEREDLYYG